MTNKPKITVTPDDGRGTNRILVEHDGIGTLCVGEPTVKLGDDTRNWAIYHANERIAELEAERDQLRDKVRQYDLMCDRISALHSERDMMKFSSDRLVIAFDAMKAERDELREQNAALIARNAEL